MGQERKVDFFSEDFDENNHRPTQAQRWEEADINLRFDTEMTMERRWSEKSGFHKKPEDITNKGFTK